MAGEHTRGGCCGLIESNVGNITRSDGSVKVRPKILPDKPRGSAWRSSARGVNCSVKSGKLMSDAMTRKLRLTPDTCYILGIYSCSIGSPISLTTTKEEMIEKFVKIATDLGVAPEKIKIEKGVKLRAFFYNSKLEKLFRNTLNRRDKVFAYKNAYALSYVAGLFDCNGGFDRFGFFLRKPNPADILIVGNLGFNVIESGGRVYITNTQLFVTLMSGYSLMLSSFIHRPGNERDLR